MTYTQQIGKATSHDELKVIGAKLFNSKISKEKRLDLVKLYRDRRRELDRSMVDASTNKTLRGSSTTSTPSLRHRCRA